MNTLYNLDTEIILWFQNLSESLTPVMKCLTIIGWAETYLLVLALIYWCIHRQIGLRMGLFIVAAITSNDLFQNLTLSPRPYWFDPRVQGIYTSTSFGMPSGHAQASTLWVYMSTFCKNKLVRGLALLLSFLVGVSRIYLGEHFIHQVLLGWLLGGCMIWGFLSFESSIVTWFTKKNVRQQLRLGGFLSFIFLSVGLSVRFLTTRFWTIPSEWIQHTMPYFTPDNYTLDPIKLDWIPNGAGMLFGLILGLICLLRYGGHEVGGGWLLRGLRGSIGIILLLGVFVGTEMISPPEEIPVLYGIWQYVRHMFIVFAVIFLFPYGFTHLKLARRRERI